MEVHTYGCDWMLGCVLMNDGEVKNMEAPLHCYTARECVGLRSTGYGPAGAKGCAQHAQLTKASRGSMTTTTRFFAL
jgi:hypothetical protein